MNNRNYLIPGLKEWRFETSDAGYKLWSGRRGYGVDVTADMPAQEIANRVTAMLWFELKLPREVAKTAEKPMLRVDWQAMIKEAGTDVQLDALFIAAATL